MSDNEDEIMEVEHDEETAVNVDELDDLDDIDLEDFDEVIKQTKEELLENSYDTQLQNKLLRSLYKNHDLEEFDKLKDELLAWMPLSFENWLLTIKRLKELGTDEAIIEKNFNQAVQDANCVQIWLEWIYSSSSDIHRAREICERALASLGTRYDCGNLIWETYIFIETQQPMLDEEGKNKQIDRILNLFKRALRIPFRSNKLISDAEEFCQQLEDNTIFLELRTVYETARKKGQKLEVFEKLIDAGTTKMEGLKKFMDYEVEIGDMARIQSIHERYVSEYDEDEYVWSAYGAWCEQKLKVPSVTCKVYERAIRHCPYSCLLNQQCLLAFERANEPNEKIDRVWEATKEIEGFPADDIRGLYRTYIYLLKRRVVREGSNDYSKVVSVIEEGSRKMQEMFKTSWDPKGEYRQNQAYFYASVLKDIEKTRQVWNDILSSGGFGKTAKKCIEAAKIERQFGDNDFVRKYLNKALNNVAESEINEIYEYYVQFEREEGTLEQLDLVLEKVNSQVANRAARPQKKVVEKVEKPVAPKRSHESQPVAKKAKTLDKPGFRAPDLPVKKPSATPATSSSTDSEEASRTIFVSNLDFGTTEEDIKKVIDGVKSVRFATRPKSDLHRGFGYVVLEDVGKMKNALEKDRVLVNGRPMFISENNPEKRVGFKYSTDLEKKKLFVRNVHFKATEDDLKNIFAKFGEVASIRMVRHKNGLPKGVAYVEFEKEEAAEKALKEKEIMLKERTLFVALSNPPAKDSKKKNEDDEEMKVENGPRKGHAGMLQFVPRSATVNSATVSKPSVTPFAQPAGKPLSNDMFRAFLKKN